MVKRTGVMCSWHPVVGGNQPINFIMNNLKIIKQFQYYIIEVIAIVQMRDDQ